MHANIILFLPACVRMRLLGQLESSIPHLCFLIGRNYCNIWKKILEQNLKL